MRLANYLYHDRLPLSNSLTSKVVTAWFIENVIRIVFKNPWHGVEGSAWHARYLRLFGVNVGQNFFCPENMPFTDPIFAYVGDDVTMDYNATMHQHSFEDGMLKWGPRSLGSGSTLMQSSCLAFSDTLTDVVLRPGSVTWKGQELESLTQYEGSPAKPVTNPAANCMSGV